MTYYVAFRKVRQPRSIRLEFAIAATTKQEARTIAEKEAARLELAAAGYHHQGAN